MKNLLLVFVLVSMLFSCKKETVSIGFIQYKAIVNQVGKEAQFNIIHDDINIVSWIKINDNVYHSYNFNICEYDSLNLSIEGIGNSIRLNNDTLIIVSKSMYGSVNSNGFNNTQIEIRVYD